MVQTASDHCLCFNIAFCFYCAVRLPKTRVPVRLWPRQLVDEGGKDQGGNVYSYFFGQIFAPPPYTMSSHPRLCHAPV